MSHLLANRASDVVFLCYHSIAMYGARYLALPPSTFQEQLALLRSRGYCSGGVAELRRLAAGVRPSRPTVFLTFDDGYVDNAETAMPLMREYGFRPMIFVLPHHLERGAALDWPEVAADQRAHPDEMRSLTWPAVERLVEEGAEIGSHTLTHSHLVSLGEEQLTAELVESKEALEDRLGDCPTIAYPFGERSPAVERAAAAAGYEFAFTLPQGRHASGEARPLAIPRINVDSRDTSRRFALKLSGFGRRLLFSRAMEGVRQVRAVAPGPSK